MAARASWAVQVNATNGLIDVEDARVSLGALWTPGSSAINARSGFRPPFTSAGAVTATGTPDGFVHIAPFQLILQSVRAADGGPYIITLDATFDVNILSTPANATNPRDDLIIAQQSDTYYGDANSNWVVRQVVGTPAGSPSDPAVSGSGDYVTLARVRVDANATTIAQGKITDLRTAGHAKSLTAGLFTVAVGGIIPVDSQTQRDAITGKYAGNAVWRTDTVPDTLEVWDGSVWRTIGPRIVAKTASVPLSNNATLTPDPQLALPLAANTRYTLRGRLLYLTSAAADFKFGWTFPASTGIQFSLLGTAAGGSGIATFEQTEASVSALEGTGAGKTFYIDGVVTTAGTAGTLTMTWAQNSAQVFNTELMVTSYLELTQI